MHEVSDGQGLDEEEACEVGVSNQLAAGCSSAAACDGAIEACRALDGGGDAYDNARGAGADGMKDADGCEGSIGGIGFDRSASACRASGGGFAADAAMAMAARRAT